jgi:hypothetical protein
VLTYKEAIDRPTKRDPSLTSSIACMHYIPWCMYYQWPYTSLLEVVLYVLEAENMFFEHVVNCQR